MIRTRVIPCLLLKNAGLVKTTRFRDPRYIGDPINAVRIFNDKEVDELIFCDITASKEGREPRYELIEKIANECFMPFCYGGGVRDLEVIKRLLKLGAEKVAIDTGAFRQPSFIKQAAEMFGSQSIVVALDVKRDLFGRYHVRPGNVAPDRSVNPVEYAQSMQEMGAGELFVNSIDRDGMMNGYDLELIRSIVNAVDVPTIACGGAGSVEHIYDLIDKTGAAAAAAGSLFVYYGREKGILINYPKKEQLKRLWSSEE